MNIDILTLFPNMFTGPMTESIIGKAVERELVSINPTNIRDYAFDKHNTVDDYPFGGGAGMLLRVEPIVETLEAIERKDKSKVILVDPTGKPFTQQMAQE